MASILPGEKNPSAPRVRKRNKRGPVGGPGKDSKNTGPVAPGMPGGKPKMPLPTEPSPVARYGKLKKAFATPGMQPGEKAAIDAIAKKRGVTPAKAAQIGKMRTGLGLTTAGISGPSGMTLKKAPARTPVKNPKPVANGPDQTPPQTGPKPRLPARKMPVKMAGRKN